MISRGDHDVTLYVDGAAKGNPGPAGIGIRLEKSGKLIKEFSSYIGKTTNNTAEYQALIQGLQIAKEMGVVSISVISDSELVVKQVKGLYRVKNLSLLPLYQSARKLAGGFSCFQICHVPRFENRQADRLANEGILQAKLASGPDGCT